MCVYTPSRPLQTDGKRIAAVSMASQVAVVINVSAIESWHAVAL
jgi:hypothetical protein